jgi:hypothetical protein
MAGLGIIDTDLCLWAGQLTQADLDAAYTSLGHPVVKAKPDALPDPVGWFERLMCSINSAVSSHPVLVVGAVVGGYFLLRGKRK